MSSERPARIERGSLRFVSRSAAAISSLRAMMPGEIELQRMPSRPQRLAMWCVTPLSADFDAAYATRALSPREVASDTAVVDPPPQRPVSHGDDARGRRHW